MVLNQKSEIVGNIKNQNTNNSSQISQVLKYHNGELTLKVLLDDFFKAAVFPAWLRSKIAVDVVFLAPGMLSFIWFAYMSSSIT